MEFDNKAAAISRELKKRIADGVWHPGDKLPTTLELAGDFQVAKVTMTQALALLVQDGVIIGKRGVGYMVKSTLPKLDGRREIGFFFPSREPESVPFWSLLACGAAEVALKQGFRLFMVPDSERSMRESLERCHVKNVIILGEHPVFFERFLLSGLHRELNYIFLTRGADFAEVNHIDEAGVAGLTRIFRQLVAAGHRRLGLLGTDAEFFSYTRHYAAYRQLFRELGEPATPLVRRISEQAGQEEYDAGLASLMKQEQPPTLLVVYRARFLEGSLRALDKLGVRIPEDLQLLVIDNDLGDDYRCLGRNIANFSLPSKKAFAGEAVRQLISLILHPELVPLHAELDFTWHPGTSCRFSP